MNLFKSYKLVLSIINKAIIRNAVALILMLLWCSNVHSIWQCIVFQVWISTIRLNYTSIVLYRTIFGWKLLESYTSYLLCMCTWKGLWQKNKGHFSLNLVTMCYRLLKVTSSARRGPRGLIAIPIICIWQYITCLCQHETWSLCTPISGCNFMIMGRAL